MEKIGLQFQNGTKMTLDFLREYKIEKVEAPEKYKTYPDKRTFPLCSTNSLRPKSLRETIDLRRSVRSFLDKPLELQELSFLVWSALAENCKKGKVCFRTSPSAGASYPIEAYLVVNNVSDLPQGIYHYNVKENLLELIDEGDHGDDLVMAALGQKFCGSCQVTFLFSAMFGRTTWKYKDRGYRYAYLDAGHIGHAISLASTAIGLGSVLIGAFLDEEMDKLIGLDGEKETIIYGAAVGYPKK